jgi:hypothetical protein
MDEESLIHGGGGMPGLSRDERKRLALSLPILCHEIINLPMDE